MFKKLSSTKKTSKIVHINNVVSIAVGFQPDMELTYATELQVTKAEREKGPEITYCLPVAFNARRRKVKSRFSFSDC